jgi:hypothetical protein
VPYMMFGGLLWLFASARVLHGQVGDREAYGASQCIRSEALCMLLNCAVGMFLRCLGGSCQLFFDSQMHSFHAKAN